MIPVIFSLPLRDNATDGPAKASTMGFDLMGNFWAMTVTAIMESERKGELLDSMVSYDLL